MNPVFDQKNHYAKLYLKVKDRFLWNSRSTIWPYKICVYFSLIFGRKQVLAWPFIGQWRQRWRTGNPQQARAGDAPGDSWGWTNVEFIPCNNQRINGQMATRTGAQQMSLTGGQMWLWGHKEDNWPYLQKSIWIFPVGTNEHFAVAYLEC